MDERFSFKAMALAIEHSTPRVLFLSGSAARVGAGGAITATLLLETLRFTEPGKSSDTFC